MDMKNELCSYPIFLNPDKQAFKETHIAKFCTIYNIYHINSPLIYFRISSFIFEWEVKRQSGTSAENYSQTNLPTRQSMPASRHLPCACSPHGPEPSGARRSHEQAYGRGAGGAAHTPQLSACTACGGGSPVSCHTRPSHPGLRAARAPGTMTQPGAVSLVVAPWSLHFSSAPFRSSAEASNPNTLSGLSSQFINKFAWKC